MKRVWRYDEEMFVSCGAFHSKPKRYSGSLDYDGISIDLLDRLACSCAGHALKTCVKAPAWRHLGELSPRISYFGGNSGGSKFLHSLRHFGASDSI
jgi:hypothetical protein